MNARTRCILALLAIVPVGCKKDKKEEPPLEDPCGLFCEEYIRCCQENGLARCDESLSFCLVDCEARRTDCTDSDIDFDRIATCVDETATCHQILGLDEDGFEETYTGCLAEVTGCPHLGSCTSDGDTHCCRNALATCSYSDWVIDSCQSICLLTDQVYAGSCNDASGTDACTCETPPAPCTLYCDKGTTYCEEVEWQGCDEEGIEGCTMLTPPCVAACEALGEDMTASGIDPDAVTICIWHHSTPLQVLGCDASGTADIYSMCLAEVIPCPVSGSCSDTEEGDTRCCGGALATCNSGMWDLEPCETICREDTPETPSFTGVCEAIGGVDACRCEAA